MDHLYLTTLIHSLRSHEARMLGRFYSAEVLWTLVTSQVSGHTYHEPWSTSRPCGYQVNEDRVVGMAALGRNTARFTHSASLTRGRTQTLPATEVRVSSSRSPSRTAEGGGERHEFWCNTDCLLLELSDHGGGTYPT